MARTNNTPDMGFDPTKIDSEVWAYYFARRDGSIPERSYESWGPVGADEERYIEKYMNREIKWAFRRVNWDEGFTGRDLPKSDGKGIDEVGPKDELIDSSRGRITLDLRNLKRQDSNATFEEDIRSSKKRKLCGSERLKRLSTWAKQRPLRFAKKATL